MTVRTKDLQEAVNAAISAYLRIYREYVKTFERFYNEQTPMKDYARNTLSRSRAFVRTGNVHEVLRLIDDVMGMAHALSEAVASAWVNANFKETKIMIESWPRADKNYRFV